MIFPGVMPKSKKARLNIMPKVELMISQITIRKIVKAIRLKKAATSGSIV